MTPVRRPPIAATLSVMVALCAASLTAFSADARPAHDREVVATHNDARGDVRLHSRVKGLTATERRSIDLYTVTISRRDTITRFTVRLRDIRRTRGWDQMVFINYAPDATSPDDWSGSIGFSPQQLDVSYAFLAYDPTATMYESCDPLRARVAWRRDQIRLDVPHRCLPDDPAHVRVGTFTGYFRSDATNPWSRDTARLSGAVPLT